MASRNYGPNLARAPRHTFLAVGLAAVPAQWRLLRSRRELAGPIPPGKGESTWLALSTPWLVTRRAWATLTGNVYRPRDSNAFIHLVPLSGSDRPNRFAKLATATLASATAFGFWIVGARGLVTTEYAIANALDITRAVAGMTRYFDPAADLPGGALAVAAVSPTAFNYTGMRWLSSTRRSLKKSQRPVWEVRAIDAPSMAELAHALDVAATESQSRGARLVAEAPSSADEDLLLDVGFIHLESPRQRLEPYPTMVYERRREFVFGDTPAGMFPVEPGGPGGAGCSPDASELDSHGGRVPISAGMREPALLAREISPVSL